MKIPRAKASLLVLIFLALTTFSIGDTLTTIDHKVYEGKMVAFRYGSIIFNIYKFGKYHSRKNFPLSQIWKIEFNAPKRTEMQSSFEMESNYKKWRRGKRIRRIKLSGTQQWLDTGITLKEGQEILFSASGSIYINKKTQVFQTGELEVRWHKLKPLPTQPTGALIARISEAGSPFYVGSNKTPFQAPVAGKLFLGINDFTMTDNSGEFLVTIYY
jgi:hypothetical protein